MSRWRGKGGGKGSGRMNAKQERDAWTAFVDGTAAPKPTKFRSTKTDDGEFQSLHEGEVAMKLRALARDGKILDLQEQVRFVLVKGGNRVKGVAYWADFVYRDLDGTQHVLDAKGFKMNPVYRMKKRMMFHLLGITIEEV